MTDIKSLLPQMMEAARKASRAGLSWRTAFPRVRCGVPGADMRIEDTAGEYVATIRAGAAKRLPGELHYARGNHIALCNPVNILALCNAYIALEGELERQRERHAETEKNACNQASMHERVERERDAAQARAKAAEKRALFHRKKWEAAEARLKVAREDVVAVLAKLVNPEFQEEWDAIDDAADAILAIPSALERLGGEGKGAAQSQPCGDAKSAAPDAEGSGWRPIESAPIQVEGHLWCAELSSLTNATGFTVRAPGGGVDVVSTWRGWHFTHWHPLPEPPTEVERRSPAVAP